MKNFVVGFLFSNDLKSVALIEKVGKPGMEYLDKKLNGIGGHIENDETPYHAMIREFKEETGVWFAGWTLLATLSYSKGIIYFYYGFDDNVFNVKTNEDKGEKVGIYSSNIIEYDKPIMENLKVLIPLALHKDFQKPVHFYTYSFDSDVVLA